MRATATLLALRACLVAAFHSGLSHSPLGLSNFRSPLRQGIKTHAEAVDGKSALVLGWFGATEGELAFVEKIYKKKGYSDVVVQSSKIADCSKPRGWYRAVKNMVRVPAAGSAAPVEAHALSRKFDTVHVLSGGFLNLYLQLLGGAQLDYDLLVLDSTPILPSPQSYTRFARAYMATMPAPANWIPKVVPYWLHLSYVSLRWSMAAAYVGLRHQLAKLLTALGLTKAAGASGLEGPKHIAHFAWAAVTMRYRPIVDDCVSTVFSGATRRQGAPPLKAKFVTNRADPYLAYSDVEAAMQAAAALGCEVEEVEGYKDHVKSLFRKPGAIFGSKVAAPTVAAPTVAAPAAAEPVPAAEVAAAPAADATVVDSSAKTAAEQTASNDKATPEYQTFKYFAQ